ncbi:MAG: hypothetical protein KC645_04245, partial [Gemmatimonadetes bacterium]|nr:hypothetical protein [Gemmatimonadota bacterium]
MRLRRPWSRSSLLGRGVLCAGLATLACQAEAAHDLDRALGLDGDRVLAHPPPSSELDWTDLRTGFAGRDTLLLQPRSLCFLRDRLLVADGAGPRIEWFDLDGEHHRTLGRAGEAPGEFRGLGSLRCREDGAAFMAVDAPQHRIQWFDSAGRHLRSIPTPPIPAGFPYQGEFALAQDGHWVDSWLAVPVGPVLDHESDWEGVALARIWDGEGTLVSEAGRPVPYADPTLRRILNQVSPEFVGDTLWLLTHA